MMKTITAIFFVCFHLLNAQAQFTVPQTNFARSRSGQFVVYGVPPAPMIPSRFRAPANTPLAHLEAPLLAVSCERIKQALLSELSAPDRWRGKIYIVLHQVRSLDATIVVTSSRFKDGWSYQMEMPDAVEPARLVRAVVQVLLLELANRNAGQSLAEIPTWLTEGLSQQLQSTSQIDLVLQSPQWTVNNVTIRPVMSDARRSDALSQAHERLRDRAPLTLEELSWPKAEQLTDDAGEVYRSSAQLFVYELVSLKNGRACLRTMLGELSQYLNWQTAFLHSFRFHFERQLDAEKWWALQLVHFTGRDPAQTWSSEESWKKFDEIVRPAVQVRLGTGDLPFHTDVTLQAIIKEWDYVRQNQVLNAKTRQLQALELRILPELIALVDDYRQALESYLQKMEKAGVTLNARKQTRPGIKRIIEETLARLDALDAKREAFRNGPVAAADVRDDHVPSR